ncbi:50S ribosomal protein L9 [Mycoplasmopsis pulmonis]|uniref:Large ribosomal subunit protein bL9 n=1 Tax=Mycoplasmopsis pulmonis (strain UAB CTIP) TaxID=272635 RepID=RL9_MYCPU|nr:50S ribosomal protein L9 [Mycoplasmopsis pulmonis]Q98Q52.2 RecName: Full=Large ribosomal subunit protein bL9; AltName: Full=50S ribosomal protein L9 [Mycoplasmopsis pulmonis UAB CTIP]MDZ7293474.1 50S ribosomal protein L9 [Mycoplasmopsis pulmonis]VEU68284.1 50S ribosomal protein L9 [Mycoplasmopsis pulmonis]
MKLILIKDCPSGKANTIVEVSDGYAKNFLIPRKFAIAYTEENAKKLKQKLEQEKLDFSLKTKEFLELKEKLEKLKLTFKLKASLDKNHKLETHHSISAKKLLERLHELGFDLPKHSIEKVHLNLIGINHVNVKLFDKIVAKLTVVIEADV